MNLPESETKMELIRGEKREQSKILGRKSSNGTSQLSRKGTGKSDGFKKRNHNKHSTFGVGGEILSNKKKTLEKQPPKIAIHIDKTSGNPLININKGALKRMSTP